MEDSQTTPPPGAAQAPAPGPVMDVVAPPPRSTDEAVAIPPPAEDHSKPQPPAAPAHQKAPAQPKRPRASGVTAAIFATVIIVLGLAALAVYAYLKQK